MLKSPKLVISILFISSTIIQAQSFQVEQVAYDYSDLYEKTFRSVVKIEAEGGSGSGFIVDAEKGLIATNHHVVRGSRFLAVRFSDQLRVKAVPIKLSPRFDLAILKIHPSLTRERATLPLLPLEESSCIKPGLPVVAFGSPLSQDFLVTQGIISKVEEKSLLGDFLIKPGNSGGPLLDLKGRVIGVNTYSVDDIAGAVRGYILQQILLETLQQNLDKEKVSPESLRNLPTGGFPTELLKQKILETDFDLKEYQFDADKFTVTAFTPVFLGRAQVREDLIQASNRYERRGRKIADPSYSAMDDPYYEWRRGVEQSLDMAIRFQIMPEIGQTGGSLFQGLLVAGLTGMRTRSTFEFKGEFLDFRAYRDGELLEPVLPGRRLIEALRDDVLAKFMDEAYSGEYSYDPNDFMTGKIFTFEVFDARDPNKPHFRETFRDNSRLILKLREDFKGTPILNRLILPKLETTGSSELDFTCAIDVDPDKRTADLSIEIPHSSIQFGEINNEYHQILRVVAGVFDENGEIIGSLDEGMELIVEAKEELITGYSTFEHQLSLTNEGIPTTLKVVIQSAQEPEIVGFSTLSIIE